jgi:hypothetical protein
LFGVTQQSEAGALHTLSTIAIAQLKQTGRADVTGRKLGAQVALAFFGSTNIVEQQLLYIAIDGTGTNDFHRGNAKTFLVNFATRTHGSGEGAADVGVMGAGRDEKMRRGRTPGAGCALADEDRRDDGDVRQVRAAAEGIVEHGDVAGVQRKLGNRGAHRHGHGAEMHRHVIAHGQGVAGGIEERAGVIATLLDVGRERGAAQGRAHLFGDGVEEMAEDLEFDGIKAHGGSVPREAGALSGRWVNHKRRGRATKFRTIFVDIPIM